SRVRRCGPQRVTSTRAKRTRPEVGRTVPEIRWKSVDFPAPFGPITACREPASTVSVTPATARSSPYLRPTPCSSTTLMPPVPRSARARGASSREPLPHPARAPDEAEGKQVDDEDEGHAEHELPVRREHVREPVAQDVVEGSSEDGTDQRPLAADHDRHDRDRRHLERHAVRREVLRLLARERPRIARDRARDREHRELVELDVVPERSGARLVLADRRKRAAERRAHDEPEDRVADEEDADDVPVEVVG